MAARRRISGWNQRNRTQSGLSLTDDPLVIDTSGTPVEGYTGPNDNAYATETLPAPDTAAGSVSIDTRSPEEQRAVLDRISKNKNGEYSPFPFALPKRIPTVDQYGNLLPQFKLDVTSDRPESAWLRMQLERQGLEEQRGIGLADKDAAVNRANVMSSAAQLGGASSSAAERLGSRFAKDAALQQQDIRAQGAWGRLGLRESDLQRQIGGDQYNIQQALGQIQQTYGADSDTFRTLAEAYSAEQLANAMGSGGGSGGGGVVQNILGGVLGTAGEVGEAVLQPFNPNNYGLDTGLPTGNTGPVLQPGQSTASAGPEQAGYSISGWGGQTAQPEKPAPQQGFSLSQMNQRPTNITSTTGMPLNGQQQNPWQMVGK